MGLLVKGPPSQGYPHHFPYEIGDGGDEFSLHGLLHQMEVLGSTVVDLVSTNSCFQPPSCPYNP